MISPSPRTLPTLPTDVIHCILLQVKLHGKWDPYCIGQCSLVCKEWRDVAQPLVFSYVSIKARPNGVRFYEFFDFVRSHPHLARCIKRLTLTIQRHPSLFHAYNSDEEDEDDFEEGEGLPAMYGEEAAMLDFAAFISILPHLKGLDSLWLAFVALWLPDDSNIVPATSALKEFFINGLHCSLPVLLSGLQITSLRKMILRHYSIDGWVDTPLPLMCVTVDELDLSSRAGAPSSFMFYERILNTCALRKLSMRCEKPEPIDAMCAFLRKVDVGGLTTLALDFNPYFKRYGPTLVPVPWQAIARAIQSACKGLRHVELNILPWVSANPEPGISPFRTLTDTTPFLRATLPTLPRLSLRLERANGDTRPLSSQMVDNLIRDLSTLDDVCSELYQGSARMERFVLIVQSALFRPESVSYELVRPEIIETRVREAMPKLGAAGVLKVVVTGY